MRRAPLQPCNSVSRAAGLYADAKCAIKGDVIDLWARLKGLKLRDAALDLVQVFNLEPAPRTEKRNG